LSVDTVLDHYYLYLRNNCYAVVVGNAHSSGYIIGYQKYCRSHYNVGPWQNGLGRYRRLVPVYDPVIVHESTPWKTYVHSYGALSPIIPRSQVVSVYDPVKRIKDIISSPKDDLEKTLVDIIYAVKMYAGNVNIGVTGSILVGIHVPGTSDIDLVVYGPRDSIKVVEAFNEVINTTDHIRMFNKDELLSWAQRLENRLRINKDIISRYFYRPWRRGKVNDIDYSIIYNDGVYKHIDLMEPWQSIGMIKAKVCIEPFQVSALNYPSEAYVHRCETCDDIEIRMITSYEALYIPFLYEGGCAVIEGLLQKSTWYGDYRIVVGVAENRGKIVPVERG